MSTEPSFVIPARPRRRFPRRGGVEYEGETVFHLEPAENRTEADVEPVVEAVLSAGPYRAGDFLELPMAVWLVRDDETADVFRISVRDGNVRLHVLPETEPEGLRAFYERLDDETDCAWAVTCDTTAPE